MKVWKITATILLVVAIGLGGWLYVQNKNLKSQKSQVETDLSSAKADKVQSEEKMAAARKKLGILILIFGGTNSQEDQLAVYNAIKSINDETLTADWKAMQTSTPGDNTGNKMLSDLIVSAVKDLE